MSDDALAAVTAFARATGDLAVLSATDVEIMALAYMVEREVNGAVFLRPVESVRPRKKVGEKTKSALFVF